MISLDGLNSMCANNFPQVLVGLTQVSFAFFQNGWFARSDRRFALSIALLLAFVALSQDKCVFGEESTISDLEGIAGVELTLNEGGEIVGIQATGGELRDKHLLGIESLPKLRRLDIGNATGISDEGLIHVSRHTSLEWLTLPATATDVSVGSLGMMANLRGLDLGRTRATDASLRAIVVLPKLEFLYLHDTRVSDAGVLNLRKTSKLKLLDLNRTSVSDRGLESVARCKLLKYLHLQGTNVGDNGISHLASLSHLQDLSLPETKVTDNVIEPVSKLKTLKHLDLRLTNVSKNAVDKLRSALPDCAIDR